MSRKIEFSMPDVHRRKAHSKNPAIVATNKIIAAATAAPTRLSSQDTAGFVGGLFR
jgi:hypothetical protein